MTARQLISLFLVAIAVQIIGALFKIQHWPLADLFLTAASVVQAVALLLLVFKILNYPGFKDFLDR